jgi:hypothetical protein
MRSNTAHMIVGAVLFAVGVACGYGLALKYPGLAPGGGISSREGGVPLAGSHEGPTHAGETSDPKK